jgi:HK97 family phage prohead protease
MKSLDTQGTFAGYGSVFNNVDSYNDVVMPGAFNGTLAQWQAKGRFPPILWQHDSKQPIGPFTAMREDAKGLYVEGKLLINDVQMAREAYALMSAGAIGGMSIGYNPLPGGETFNPVTKRNELHALELWEVSVVTFPANQEARIESVKSIAAASFDEIEQVIRRMFPATPRRLASRIASACLESLSESPEPSPVDLAALATALGGCKQSFIPRK